MQQVSFAIHAGQFQLITISRWLSSLRVHGTAHIWELSCPDTIAPMLLLHTLTMQLSEHAGHALHVYHMRAHHLQYHVVLVAALSAYVLFKDA